MGAIDALARPLFPRIKRRLPDNGIAYEGGERYIEAGQMLIGACQINAACKRASCAFIVVQQQRTFFMAVSIAPG